MELVYLWVEDYKNIKKQGFNFSPRFRCEYNEDTNELTIDENKDYVSIFPENINITAIVGENGTGKSSLFEHLDSSFGEKLFITFQNNRIDISTYINELKIKSNTKYENTVKEKRLNQIHFSWDILQHEPILDFSSYFDSNPNILSHILGTFHHPEYIDLQSYQNNSVIKYLDIFRKDKINIFSFSPNKINIKLLIRKQEDWDFGQIKEEIDKLSFPKEEVELKKESYFESIKKFIVKYLSEGNNEKDFTLEEYFTLIKDFENMKEILSRFKPFIINIYDDDISFFDLSHGERSILLSNALIYDSIIENKKQNTVICLDEPDLSLHPVWQKKYVNELIKTFSKVFKNLHFLITSHSPFILSDLPKENVIFLKKDDSGNCKNVTEDTNIDTFGANIHTLLSHGFFMKDGLMGEFAKSKIEEIFKYLKEDEPLKTINEIDVEYVIGLIGEDFLRDKLLNMYKTKFNIKSKDEEIAELKAEIERLKNDSNSI